MQGVPVVAQQVENLANIHEDADSISGLAQQAKDLVLLQAVQITDAAQTWHYYGCGVGLSYSSDSTPSLGTSTCHTCGPKKEKEKV